MKITKVLLVTDNSWKILENVMIAQIIKGFKPHKAKIAGTTAHASLLIAD